MSSVTGPKVDPQRAALWLIIYTIVLVWSLIKPHDYPTWALEVAPALIGLLVMALTIRRFPLTRLVYILILVHSIILMIGGHYTYAEVPLFDLVRDLTGSQRNDYDKLGHLMQGLGPALVTREIFLRLAVVNGRGWLNFLIICVCLAISAVYELVEWGVALISQTAAESFLGTQGYVWDTQSDMAWALTGAIVGLISLSSLHDRQLAAFGVGRDSSRGSG